jgi:predicted phosphoribosyltransferase
LAKRLHHLCGPDAVVLALPRGGVVVGYEVALKLGAPLDVLIVRKLGAPWHPEFGFGAIAAGGVRLIDERSVQALGLTDEHVDQIAQAELAELERRNALYRGGRPGPAIEGRTAILVDDGLATGVTARAAVRAIRHSLPKRLVLAVPVGPPDTVAALSTEVDELICLETPHGFRAVGQWYRFFDQTTDAEVVELLECAQHAGKAH